MKTVNIVSLRVLERALEDIPGLTIARVPSPDTQTLVQIQDSEDKRHEVHLIWAGEGWPGDIRVVIEKVPDPWPRQVVVAARHLSKGAIEELSRREANWVDEAGNLRLVIPPVLFVHREASKTTGRRPSLFAWSKSSEEIAEMILNCPDRRFVIPAITDETSWSAGQVSLVLQEFDERGWTLRRGPPRGKGVWRGAGNLGSLLEAWSAHLVERRPEKRLGHRLLRDPLDFLGGELASLIGDRGAWGVTGWAGLEIRAPFVTALPSLQVYLSESLWSQIGGIEQALEISPVENGASIEFWRAPRRLFVTNMNGVNVVTPPRLYTDLLALGGRARDGAYHLREAVLDF